MVRPFTRFKLLLDEGFFPKKELRRVNSRHDVKHIRKDYSMQGKLDETVYDRAKKEGRLMVVINRKHFRYLVNEKDNSGIIGVSGNITIEEIDKKLSALLLKSRKNDLYGKYTSITKSGVNTNLTYKK